MATGNKRAKHLAAKRSRKQTEYSAAKKDAKGPQSKYALKRKYLDAHGLHGTQVPEPKPWKKM